jgi:4'-phosphopantetheinyl transferase
MLTLGSYEAHTWCIPLQQCEAHFGSLWDVLSHDERDRAMRYRCLAASCWFVCRRGALRIILGRYLGVKPGNLRFARSALGKPYLVEGEVELPVRFNVSSSGDFALLAVTRGTEVGIDVERLDEGFQWSSIARHFFASDEQKALSTLPEEQRLLGFMSRWTMKEACAKALGQGLGAELEISQASGDFLGSPGHVAEFQSTKENHRWLVANVISEERYIASVAVYFPHLPVTATRWRPCASYRPVVANRREDSRTLFERLVRRGTDFSHTLTAPCP